MSHDVECEWAGCPSPHIHIVCANRKSVFLGNHDLWTTLKAQISFQVCRNVQSRCPLPSRMSTSNTRANLKHQTSHKTQGQGQRWLSFFAHRDGYRRVALAAGGLRSRTRRHWWSSRHRPKWNCRHTGLCYWASVFGCYPRQPRTGCCCHLCRYLLADRTHRLHNLQHT